MPRCLVGRDQAADRRPDHIVDLPVTCSPDLSGQRLAQRLGLVGMHEDPRLLQEDRAAQARGQDEMPFEHRARVAENVDHLARYPCPLPSVSRSPCAHR